MLVSNVSTKINHYTYKITHANGKYYVGRRSCKGDPHKDKYMGSGKWVKGIKDKSLLTKQIITHYNTFDELKLGEVELIEKYFDDEYCMNFILSSSGYGAGDKHPMYGRTGELSSFYGKTHTKEAKRKISKANIGKHLTEETRQKISNAGMGRVCKDETRRKLSANMQGNTIASGHKQSVEHKQKISDAGMGRVCKDETRRKLSISKSVSNNPNSKLTEALVQEIRIKIISGKRNIDLAKEYDVDSSIISDIRHNKIWKQVNI